MIAAPDRRPAGARRVARRRGRASRLPTADVPIAGLRPFDPPAPDRGLGIASLPDALARPHVDAGRLRWVMADWATPMAALHADDPSRRQSSRALQVVIEALRDRG